MFIALPAFTLIYGVSTWDWGDQKSFHVNLKGFFGENTNAGGANKTGHAFSHFLAFRALYNWKQFAFLLMDSLQKWQEYHIDLFHLKYYLRFF